MKKVIDANKLMISIIYTPLPKIGSPAFYRLSQNEKEHVIKKWAEFKRQRAS